MFDDKEYKKQWYIRNRKRILEKRKRYYIKNQERIKQYYIKNKEEINEKRKKYHIKNKEYIKQYNKEQRERNPGYKKQWHKNNPEYNKKYYKKNRRKALIDHKNWRENNLEYMKQWKDRNKEHCKEYRKKCYKRCKECDKKWYQENRERILKRMRLYFKTEKGKATAQRGDSKRRARINNIHNTLTAKEWIDILEEHKYKCAYCGKEFNLFDKPEKDHVVPLSKGGHNTKENVVPACKSCNLGKHNKIIKIRGEIK